MVNTSLSRSDIGLSYFFYFLFSGIFSLKMYMFSFNCENLVISSWDCLLTYTCTLFYTFYLPWLQPSCCQLTLVSACFIFTSSLWKEGWKQFCSYCKSFYLHLGSASTISSIFQHIMCVKIWQCFSPKVSWFLQPVWFLPPRAVIIQTSCVQKCKACNTHIFGNCQISFKRRRHISYLYTVIMV